MTQKTRQHCFISTINGPAVAQPVLQLIIENQQRQSVNMLHILPGHGVRVSEETDKCEETTSDDPKKAGYIYAETNVFEKKFTKPVNIFEPIFWKNVKGIGQGFRFDLFLSSPSGELSEINNAISVKFENSSHALNVDFFSSMEGENVQISEYEQQSDDVGRIVHKELSTEKPADNILKLSILAQGDSLKVILDNKEVFTQRLQIINTNSLQQFSVNIFHKPIGTTMLLFHGYCLNIE
ncbi:uncharacterized protein LOC132755542 [Ruditapes philippinarum]|uniref:uncharacterized protein LOC132755542 n=1 Tax=Ruditapes philippinarum TaxID=129788 RepID=UPI00295A6D67|nr:uncharacterized protein LOC132755542 [Ruditapes philippinarum]